MNFEKRLKPILSLWKKLNDVMEFLYQAFLHFLHSEWVHLFFQGVYIVQSTDDMNDNPHITDPWSAFVHSEFMLARKLFKTVHQTLIVMHTATRDISSINRSDLSLMRVICENQVPLKWRQIWSGPRLLTDYLKAIVCRGIEANNRFNEQRNIEFGEKIDFAKIYNVESFLAALKLRNARESQQSTCDLHLTTSLAGPISALSTTRPNVAPLLVWTE